MNEFRYQDVKLMKRNEDRITEVQIKELYEMDQHETDVYLIPQLDEEYDDKLCLSEKDDFRIPQLDGGNDDELCLSEKNVFATNCEIEEIHLLTNFLRSFHHIWNIDGNHSKCNYDAKN